VTTKTYLLRDIPAGLWTRVAKQAQRDGLTLRGLILVLLKGYYEGSIRVTPARGQGTA
jgi:hypothetical protein